MKIWYRGDITQARKLLGGRDSKPEPLDAILGVVEARNHPRRTTFFVTVAQGTDSNVTRDYSQTDLQIATFDHEAGVAFAIPTEGLEWDGKFVAYSALEVVATLQKDPQFTTVMGSTNRDPRGLFLMAGAEYLVSEVALEDLEFNPLESYHHESPVIISSSGGDFFNGNGFPMVYLNQVGEFQALVKGGHYPLHIFTAYMLSRALKTVMPSDKVSMSAFSVDPVERHLEQLLRKAN